MRRKRFIHLVRGCQVIIDSDLALLYEVETKYLNRVASRHADRFPEDFRFQLDKEEYEGLRCQIVTSNDAQGGRGGRRYMPYAYTEQGVAMLSGLLNSQKVFFKGETFDTFALLADLVRTAERSIVVVDG